eukprot:CAMPEP_0173426564 /NCGR_PEP_ID=MMETSP1357-20121228/6000_1 /TAXON_ID=77926 /ORGANISM="Hemiselmis rufescens, Strain PCC563" /LENGTH=289 /DNA_ID=CAMNT_0014390261 /DNA_START=257 /DNA_END=1127 /DNA_ORIENTATION=+
MALSPLLLRPPPTWATGLAEKLKSRQSDALKKPLLPSIVVQPVKQVSYPEWLEGTWVAESRFAGYELPVKKLSKETLMKDTAIAGFQKLSVLTVPDMAASMRYPLRFVKNDNGKVVEDVAFNVASVVDNSLGYRAVQGVEYNPSKDAARVSVTFLPGKTRNAERIELFVNLAESQGSGGAFVTSQYFRQVTYSLSKEFGVARQEVGEYSHFWTYEQGDSPDQVRANLLTAAYLQPQDPLFFESPQMPVVVYSNEFRFKKLKPKAERPLAAHALDSPPIGGNIPGMPFQG